MPSCTTAPQIGKLRRKRCATLAISERSSELVNFGDLMSVFLQSLLRIKSLRGKCLRQRKNWCNECGMVIPSTNRPQMYLSTKSLSASKERQVHFQLLFPDRVIKLVQHITNQTNAFWETVLIAVASSSHLYYNPAHSISNRNGTIHQWCTPTASSFLFKKDLMSDTYHAGRLSSTHQIGIDERF